MVFGINTALLQPIIYSAPSQIQNAWPQNVQPLLQTNQSGTQNNLELKPPGKQKSRLKKAGLV